MCQFPRRVSELLRVGSRGRRIAAIWGASRTGRCGEQPSTEPLWSTRVYRSVNPPVLHARVSGNRLFFPDRPDREEQKTRSGHGAATVKRSFALLISIFGAILQVKDRSPRERERERGGSEWVSEWEGSARACDSGSGCEREKEIAVRSGGRTAIVSRGGLLAPRQHARRLVASSGLYVATCISTTKEVKHTARKKYRKAERLLDYPARLCMHENEKRTHTSRNDAFLRGDIAPWCLAIICPRNSLSSVLSLACWRSHGSLPRRGPWPANFARVKSRITLLFLSGELLVSLIPSPDLGRNDHRIREIARRFSSFCVYSTRVINLLSFNPPTVLWTATERLYSCGVLPCSREQRERFICVHESVGKTFGGKNELFLLMATHRVSAAKHMHMIVYICIHVYMRHIQWVNEILSCQ